MLFTLLIDANLALRDELIKKARLNKDIKD